MKASTPAGKFRHLRGHRAAPILLHLTRSPRRRSRITYHASRLTLNASRSTLHAPRSTPPLLLAALCSLASAAELDETKLPPPAQVKVEFERDIKPIFEHTCWRCHGPERPKSHFRLDNRESALKGGDNGIDIVPGKSAKSPLVYYIARLVPDLEMPPAGKAEPLTAQQVALFRAWIDQGASWGATNPPVQLAFSAAPTLRWLGVHGDDAKFREIEGLHEGFGGGLEHFSLEEKIGPDKRVSVEGRVLVPENDFQVKLALEKTDVGFVRGGFEQWRRYYDDTGGYYRPFVVPSFNLNRDLHLDIGRAWVDFGLTLPHWPQMVVGYEYQFRDGAKSTLEWGRVNGPELKNIFPAAEDIHEHVHIVKFDLTHEFSGWLLEDRARVEFYDLNTRHDDATLYTIGPQPDVLVQTSQGATHVQGLNTVRLERQVTDWWLLSGGYLYSRFDGDASFDQTTTDAIGVPVAGTFWSSDQIQLDRETHSFSVASLLRPWQTAALSLGVQPEWTHQDGFGKVHFDEGDPNVPPSFLLQPATLESDLETRKFAEQATLRITSIPCMVLFGDARWEQDRIGQTEDQDGSETFLGGTEFERHTDFTNDRRDYRAGFNTSPWRAVELSAHYRNLASDSDYANSKIPIESQGYSAFIRARRLDTEEVQTKLAFRPANWWKLTLTYQRVKTDYRTATDPVSLLDTNMQVLVPDYLSPGGTIAAGTYDAHVYGVSVMLTPFPRGYFSGAFTYSDSRTATAQNGDPSIVPYKGNVYSVIASANYILNKSTDLHAAYSFSHAGYGQNNVADGLPLGLDYTRHGLMVGLTRKLTSYLSSNLRYGFYQYSEPSTGGFNNYTAHGVFATIVIKWP